MIHFSIAKILQCDTEQHFDPMNKRFGIIPRDIPQSVRYVSIIILEKKYWNSTIVDPMKM